MTTRAEVQAVLLDLAKSCADRAKFFLGADENRDIPDRVIESLVHTAKLALEAGAEPAVVVRGDAAFTVNQSFSDVDPEKVVEAFRRDLLKSAAKRYTEATGSPFGETAPDKSQSVAHASGMKEWLARPWTEVFGGTPETNPALLNKVTAYADPETKTMYFGFALPDYSDKTKPAS